jgi:hypothetical protein
MDDSHETGGPHGLEDGLGLLVPDLRLDFGELLLALFGCAAMPRSPFFIAPSFSGSAITWLSRRIETFVSGHSGDFPAE